MPVDQVKFSSILFQDRVVKFLSASMAGGRLFQTYLFTGKRSVGKAHTARVLASILQCLEPVRTGNGEVDACGNCLSCRRIASGTHPDVTFITPQGYDIRISQIRALQQMAILNPFLGKWRIFIFDPADRLNESSSNSLLKILEEAPSRVIFILLVESPQKVLPTILSRSVLVSFKTPVYQESREILTAQTNRSFDQVARTFSLSEGLFGVSLQWLSSDVRRQDGDILEVESPDDLKGMSVEDAQVGFLEQIDRFGESLRSRLGNAENLEESLKVLADPCLLQDMTLLHFRKSFIAGVLGAPALPEGFPILFSRIFLEIQDRLKRNLRKTAESLVSLQKQNYVPPLLKEIEEQYSGLINEVANFQVQGFFESMLNYLSDVFRWIHTGDERLLLNIDRKEDIMTMAGRWGMASLNSRIVCVSQSIEMFRRHVNPALILENLFGRIGGAKN